MEAYRSTFVLMFILILLTVVQAIVAMVAHRKQESYIPGIVKAELDHHSFVFRSHRTFMNSLENVPLFIFSVIIAALLAVSVGQLFWASLVFVIARFIHMLLFYLIATNKNPSPRSHFYGIAFLCQLYVLAATFIAIL